MSLSTINKSQDAVKTHTRKFLTQRFESTNLSTQDIDGKFFSNLRIGKITDKFRGITETPWKPYFKQARILKSKLGHRQIMSPCSPHASVKRELLYDHK
jgi:hypothetical protein